MTKAVEWSASADIESWESGSVDIEMLEREATDQRRKFRAMPLWEAWRATLRIWLGVHVLQWGELLLWPHLTPNTQTAMDLIGNNIANDVDAMREGLQERREMIERRFNSLGR